MQAPRREARVWLIGGPTASGKSALALALAEAAGGEIVNADSMQVYADLRVLTARPTEADTARAPHHLFGVVDAAEAWSVGRWLRAAAPLLARLRAEGRPAIVVGGTGLYFRALTHGLAPVPEVSEAARRDAVALFDGQGEAALRSLLRSLDPEAEARIAPGDRQRLLRAQAVAVGTGRPLSAWQADTKPLLGAGEWRGLVVEPIRETLYARCDARFDRMLEAGALEEVQALAARALDPDLPCMKALGAPELLRLLAGETTLEVAAVDAKAATRRFAKRQSTWFRNQTPDWARLGDGDPAAALALLTA